MSTPTPLTKPTYCYAPHRRCASCGRRRQKSRAAHSSRIRQARYYRVNKFAAGEPDQDAHLEPRTLTSVTDVVARPCLSRLRSMPGRRFWHFTASLVQIVTCSQIDPVPTTWLSSFNHLNSNFRGFPNLAVARYVTACPLAWHNHLRHCSPNADFRLNRRRRKLQNDARLTAEAALGGAQEAKEWSAGNLSTRGGISRLLTVSCTTILAGTNCANGKIRW